MNLISEVIYAGNFAFRRVFYKSMRQQEQSGRKPKQNPSVQKVKEMNLRAAIRRLSILMHHNFTEQSWHIIPTYRIAPTLAQAIKDGRLFRDRLRRLYRQYGVELKWVNVTGVGRKSLRPHHHLLINQGVPLSEIKKIWPHGDVKHSEAYDDADFHGLAAYFINHNSDEIRKGDTVFKNRYSHSLNVVMPTVYREEIEADEITAPLPEKGFEIIEDSLWEGFNPIIGTVFVEYIERSLKPQKRPKRKKKKQKKTRPRSSGFERWLHEHALEQLELDL